MRTRTQAIIKLRQLNNSNTLYSPGNSIVAANLERTCSSLSPHTGDSLVAVSSSSNHVSRHELFIEAIKSHPALYDKKVKEYTNVKSFQNSPRSYENN